MKIANELLKIMDDIEYGWIDKNNNIHINDYTNFESDYILQSPEEVLKNKIGLCWDQVELERNYFEKHNILISTYFIVHYDNSTCPTHTFVVFEDNNKYYWFEHSWEIFKGIHEYDTKETLLIDVKNKFIDNVIKENLMENDLVIYEYSKPKYHINLKEYFKHCEINKIMI